MIAEILKEPAFVLFAVVNLAALALVITIRLLFALLPLRVNYYDSTPQAGQRFTMTVIIGFGVLLAGLMFVMLRLLALL